MVWPKSVKKIIFKGIKFIVNKPGLKKMAGYFLKKDTYVYKRLYEGYYNYLQLSNPREPEGLPIPVVTIPEERVELEQLLKIMPINQISILLKIIESDINLANGDKHENCN